MNRPVAFLQNMWVKPHQVKNVQRWGPTSDERERMIAYALFAGCLTGRRLEQALGRELCEAIVWQEASPVIADNPRDCPVPDPDHILAVLDKHQPELVVCFSAWAFWAVEQVCHRRGIRCLGACHPAARGGNVMKILRTVAVTLREVVNTKT